ncbi:MAG: hypothetical protein CMP59_03080 [Flavobacteriales bacterium]|nr:hypothetical protein [Flavobacteriales bacterium]
MIENFLMMARYNLWADQRILNVIKGLDPELIDKEVASSFPTLRLTIAHIYDAEKIWISRLGGTVLSNWPSKTLDVFELDMLLWESENTLTYVEGLNEQEMNNICTYEDLKGNSFSQTFWQILMHVFNHATYHRGQVVTILRELEVKEIPATDLIYYLRS